MSATRDEAPTEAYERGYADGWRRALTNILRESFRYLDVDDPERQHAAWICERADVVTALRARRTEHGDNDWPDELHLGDVVEKHLAAYLDAEQDANAMTLSEEGTRQFLDATLNPAEPPTHARDAASR